MSGCVLAFIIYIIGANILIMSNRMMFVIIIALVFFTKALINIVLFLAFMIADPEETHMEWFATTLLLDF